MQCLNSGFNKFKMDDSTHVTMLIIFFKLNNLLFHIMHCVNKIKATSIFTSTISYYYKIK
jgi:hypothetical protein